MDAAIQAVSLYRGCEGICDAQAKRGSLFTRREVKAMKVVLTGVKSWGRLF
jgi:hypothetical protein